MGRTPSRVPARSRTPSAPSRAPPGPPACPPSPPRVEFGSVPRPGVDSLTEGRPLDQEPGVLTRATEGGGLDRRPGGPVVPEPPGPHLVEDRPVPLQVAHD